MCCLVGTCHRLRELEQWASSLSACSDSVCNQMIHGFNVMALSIKTWAGKKGVTSRKRASSWRSSVLDVLPVSYNWTLHYLLGSVPLLMCLCLVISQFRRTERKNWTVKSRTDQWNQTHPENYLQQEGDLLKILSGLVIFLFHYTTRDSTISIIFTMLFEKGKFRESLTRIGEGFICTLLYNPEKSWKGECPAYIPSGLIILSFAFWMCTSVQSKHFNCLITHNHRRLDWSVCVILRLILALRTRSDTLWSLP